MAFSTRRAAETPKAIKAEHGAIYSVGQFGNGFHVGAAVSYAHFDFRTNLLVTGLGCVAQEKAKFPGDEWLGRIEAGYRIATRSGDVSPIFGFEAGRLKRDGFSEVGISGPAAGLDVAGRTTRTKKSFVGLQFTETDAGQVGQFVPFERATWKHEFKADRLIDAAFSVLPGSGFAVAATDAPRNVARVNAGFRVEVARHGEGGEPQNEAGGPLGGVVIVRVGIRAGCSEGSCRMATSDVSGQQR